MLFFFLRSLAALAGESFREGKGGEGGWAFQGLLERKFDEALGDLFSLSACLWIGGVTQELFFGEQESRGYVLLRGGRTNEEGEEGERRKVGIDLSHFLYVRMYFLFRVLGRLTAGRKVVKRLLKVMDGNGCKLTVERMDNSQGSGLDGKGVEWIVKHMERGTHSTPERVVSFCLKYFYTRRNPMNRLYLFATLLIPASFPPPLLLSTTFSNPFLL